LVAEANLPVEWKKLIYLSKCSPGLSDSMIAQSFIKNETIAALKSGAKRRSDGPCHEGLSIQSDSVFRHEIQAWPR
jgi:hypothetical protein